MWWREKGFIVIYDIADPKRLRRMDRLISGYGYRIQYSVFLCSLSRTMKAELENEIRQVIHFYEDQCCLIDLGELDDPADLFVVLGIRNESGCVRKKESPRRDCVAGFRRSGNPV